MRFTSRLIESRRRRRSPLAPLPKPVTGNGKMVIMSKFAWLLVPVVAAVVVADVAAWKKNRWLGAGVTSVIGLAMYTL